MTEDVDCVVIGAGVVGLAIARELARAGREVLVLEAARAIGTGTSSRNSEVIHAGIYYPQGSLKGRLCVAGRRLLYPYCESRGVRHARLGKLIVATSAEELPILEKYRQHARDNGVDDLTPLTVAQVNALEPEVRCEGALWSPSTGIIDSHGLMVAYLADIEAHRGQVVLGAPVLGGSLERAALVLRVGGESPVELRSALVINAAGLDAQAVSSSLEGLAPQAVPRRHLAKGHYFSLAGRSPFRHLVYPIANSAGLGTHVTVDLEGQARFGPDVTWVDRIDYGFDAGQGDSRRAAFAAAIRLYYPQLDAARLQPAYTGIRPKVSGPTEPAADFQFRGPADHGGCPYVALYGIESPGLTASLAIAAHVAALLR